MQRLNENGSFAGWDNGIVICHGDFVRKKLSLIVIMQFQCLSVSSPVDEGVLCFGESFTYAYLRPKLNGRGLLDLTLETQND